MDMDPIQFVDETVGRLRKNAEELVTQGNKAANPSDFKWAADIMVRAVEAIEPHLKKRLRLRHQQEEEARRKAELRERLDKNLG